MQTPQYDHELWTARDVRSGMWQGVSQALATKPN